MGACQSATVESTVSESGNKATGKKQSAEAATSASGVSTTSGRGGTGDGNGQVGPNHHRPHHRNIDVTEKTSNEIFDSPGRSSSDDDSVDGSSNNNNNGENDYEVNIQMEFEVLPLKKSGGSNSPLHKRQSSCSSYDSWGGNSNSALSELKNELSSDDGLCTRVVRIEVRHSLYYILP